MQLQNVVGKTDQRPLALDFSQAAQEELAKPAGLFDLAEDRLDAGFSCRIHCAPRPGLKLALHAVDPSNSHCQPGGRWVAVRSVARSPAPLVRFAGYRWPPASRS